MTNALLWLVVAVVGLLHLFEISPATWCSIAMVACGLFGVILAGLEALVRWMARREEARQDDPAERARWSAGYYRRRG